MTRGTLHPEVVRHAPQRDHQVVVREAGPVGLDDVAVEIDAVDPGPPELDQGMPPEETANRIGDFARSQFCCGNLIQEWEESVVVVPVDQGYA